MRPTARKAFLVSGTRRAEVSKTKNNGEKKLAQQSGDFRKVQSGENFKCYSELPWDPCDRKDCLGALNVDAAFTPCRESDSLYISSLCLPVCSHQSRKWFNPTHCEVPDPHLNSSRIEENREDDFSGWFFFVCFSIGKYFISNWNSSCREEKNKKQWKYMPWRKDA